MIDNTPLIACYVEKFCFVLWDKSPKKGRRYKKNKNHLNRFRSLADILAQYEKNYKEFNCIDELFETINEKIKQYNQEEFVQDVVENMKTAVFKVSPVKVTFEG